jgi:hypothetical protein
VSGFAARIGGVLAAPRVTLAALVDGEARAADIGWLLVAKLVCGNLPHLVRALASGLADGPIAALSVVAVLLPDVLGVLLAGLVMSLFVDARARGYTRVYEVAAYAWVPYLAVELASALLFTALAMAPPQWAQRLVGSVAIGWAVVVWTLALLAARRAKDEPCPSP